MFRSFRYLEGLANFQKQSVQHISVQQMFHVYLKQFIIRRMNFLGILLNYMWKSLHKGLWKNWDEITRSWRVNRRVVAVKCTYTIWLGLIIGNSWNYSKDRSV